MSDDIDKLSEAKYRTRNIMQKATREIKKVEIKYKKQQKKNKIKKKKTEDEQKKK